MEDNELDKSEEATPFKLKRAREKGSVARSLDLGFFAALAAAFGFLWISGAQFAATIGQSSAQTFTFAGGLARSPDTLLSAAGILFWPIVYPLIALAAALFALVLILDFAQVGPIFSATPMKPDFNRINPAQGLKRLFSVRALIEAGKAVLKLTAYSIVAWLVISSALANEAKAIRNGMMLGGVLLSTSIKLIMYFALVALGFAAIDQILVRREFGKKIRMSRRELKREHRDNDGDPRMRQKRKELHAIFTKAAKSLRGVKDSDIIITNPFHIAVALRYDGNSMSAPSVTSLGAGGMAQRIRRLGFVYGVVSVRQPALARALHKRCRIGSEIPGDLFQDVANLYLKYGLSKKETV